MEQVEAYRQQFDHYLSRYKTLNLIEAKTRVPKVYFSLAAYLLVTISVFFNVYASLVTNLIGLAYPAYRLMEAAHKSDAEALTTFASYFLVFAAVDTVEELLLSAIMYYFPLFYVVKLVFLLWLMLPGYLGARVVYDYIAPQFAALTGAEHSKSQ